MYGCGLLSDLDTRALEAYTIAYQRRREAEFEIARSGRVIRGRDVNPVMSPFVRVSGRADDAMMRSLSEIVFPAALFFTGW